MKMYVVLKLLCLPAIVRGLTVSSKAGKARLATNVDGALYVDASCIDCDTCRWMAPKIFDRAQGKSYVYEQPRNDKTWMEAQRAAAACPTGSIRTEKEYKDTKKIGMIARDSFPFAIDSAFPNIYYLGFHSEKSFGAIPYLVSNNNLTFMVDSPRYNSKLADRIEKGHGTPSALLLTHIDDVADHKKWKDRFPDLIRVIHRADAFGADRWPYIETRDCELILEEDQSAWDILNNQVKAIHVPGHSRGHLAFRVDAETTGGDPVLFTGDHLAYSARLGRLHGMSRYGRDAIEQAHSIAQLADEDFLHILPGHGRRYSFDSQAHRRTELGVFQDHTLV